MSNGYDTTSFELDYCHQDVAKIAEAIKAKASLLVIGMPGCGKSRLIDFLLHRPGVLEKYGLSNHLRFIRVDGDALTTNPQDIYMRLLSALDYKVKVRPEGGIDALKDHLIVAVEDLEVDVDLVVIFDNFKRPLQQALGEHSFNFLFALRNARRKLNISYIFMANLRIDFLGFYKLNRLFDKGPDRSVCWVSLLSKKDAFFSIDRQLRKAGEKPDILSEDDKEKIYELGGGHALLNRHLSHLMLSDKVSLLEAEPSEVLEQHGGVRDACEAIWNDLEQNYKNLLIDVANGLPAPDDSQPAQILRKYGVLKDQAFFSPLFASFVKQQEKAGEVIGAGCDEVKTRIIVQTIDDHKMSFTLNGLPPRGRVLLCCLLANQDETCTFDRLINVGWPADDPEGVSPRALSGQVERIRSWLRKQKQLSQYIAIENVWGMGYKLVIKS